MSTNYTPIDDLVQKYKTSTISGPKEAEPLRSQFDISAEYSDMQEVVEHDTVDEEVKPHIEVRKDTIELPLEVQQSGVQPITQSDFQAYQNIKLPLTDDKVITGLHAPITSSLRWLATFATFLLWQAHLSLKVVHGKVVRVIKK